MAENLEVVVAELRKDIQTLLRQFSEVASTFATKEQLARVSDNQKVLDDKNIRVEKDVEKVKENLFRLFLALLGTTTGFGLWMLQQFLTNKV